MLSNHLSRCGWLMGTGSARKLSTAASPAAEAESVLSRPEKVHAKRIRRASTRSVRMTQRKPLTERMAAYFETKKRPTMITTSKTLAKLKPFIGLFTPKYDVDESKLSNAEYIEHAIHREVITSARIHKIIPNYLKAFTPSINLRVTYGEEAHVYRGHFLESIHTRPKPSIKYEAKEGSLYTLMMIDFDIPLKDDVQDAWNHYMVVNIPGSAVDQGEVRADWIPPAPPKNTGVHQYIWLLLEQPQKLSISEPALPSTDFNRVFNYQQFVNQHKLKPRAICFHKTQYDSHVEELYQGWGASASGFHRSDYLSQLVIKPRQYRDM